MILKQIKFQSEPDADIETVWLINSEQYQMLVNYAVNTLLKQGLVKVMKMGEEEFLKTGTDDERSEFLEYLESTDKKKMFQA
jgi:hypothetical protein